ncbi:MOSC domain-containing protein [Dactylosporangium sp. NPDC051485]|uniref:MOSC domain-containing protein n=1 Tax=Dactylosporangium sp. NPDC051485 TaxID=3154846 RepID=UPI0034185F16
MGEIVWIGRYPVKSMLGEDLGDAVLAETGIDGDRRYALIDEQTGLVASAKNPRKWRGLLSMNARYDADGQVAITLADGTVVRHDDPAADRLLSRAVGRPVRLAATRPEGATLERLTPATEPSPGAMTHGSLAAGTPGDTFVDFAAVHVLTTATLDALARAHPRHAIDARRFRPNIVVRMHDDVPFAENTWPGRSLILGVQAAVHVVAPTPRCAVPTLAQGNGLPEDPDVLRTAARVNRVPVLDLGVLTCVGAYGMVRQGGHLRVGDRVTVTA